MSVDNLSGQFALDVQGLQRLKQTARDDADAGLPEAARQFEALFLHMMLKSMREAVPQSGLLDSSQSKLYTEMLDQQWAQQLAGNGLGLADQLVGQLQQQRQFAGQASSVDEAALIAGIPRGVPRPLYGSLPVPPAESRAAETAVSDAPMACARQGSPFAAGESLPVPGGAALEARERPAHVREFLARLEAPARAASAASGVPAELILAQAALETGWGRYQIPTADGGNSHNLFGIKAGSQWRGATTAVTTSEYIDGREQKRVETFRAYPSYQASFTDYARLIGNNPRYAGVVAAGDPVQAAHALQRGGYATDPAYADKLVAVMASIGPLDAGSPRSGGALVARSTP